MDANVQNGVLLDVLRVCARQLLHAFDETHQREFYLAFEMAADACESLYVMTDKTSAEMIHYH